MYRTLSMALSIFLGAPQFGGGVRSNRREYGDRLAPTRANFTRQGTFQNSTLDIVEALGGSPVYHGQKFSSVHERK